jgi:uncharacterized protein (DUF2252 family)
LLSSLSFKLFSFRFLVLNACLFSVIDSRYIHPTTATEREHMTTSKNQVSPRHLPRKTNQEAPLLTLEQRRAAGKALRTKVPRPSHAEWTPPANRPDPINILRHTDHGRLTELLPIRYGRMKQSPFAFYRGSAAIMAWDLSKIPATGIHVQACGDCHASNFGGFASPERRLLFDINDFDETLPAPWEWDLKRLAASIVLGLREIGLSDGQCKEGVFTMAQSYRQHIHRFAKMHALDVWYSHVDANEFIRDARTQTAKERWRKIEAEARKETGEHIVPEITTVKNGRMRVVDHPPLVYHPRESDLIRKHVTEMFRRYRSTLPDERRILLDHYQIVDVARKVVGVGSVGTRCAVALLLGNNNGPLLLQFKEALPSILEPYAGKSRYTNHGERVVTGQRMLQSASDVFLGWTHDDRGHHYYFRQLRDMKMKIDLSRMRKTDWFEYVEICGWTLARAQARTGDAARIAGYLGTNDKFDCALVKFAVRYANQTDRDYQLLLKAIRAGRLQAGNSAA